MTKTLLEKLAIIPEISENILLHLPLRDLLHAQRVCRHWQEVVAQSQQKLFFQPVARANYPFRLNELLQELFPPFFLPEKFDVPLSMVEREAVGAYDIYQLDWYNDETHREAVLKTDASWRRMYPAQLPLRIQEINMHNCDRLGDVYKGQIADEYQYLQERGALTGLIWDTAIHMVDHSPIGDFFIQWHMPSKLDTAEEKRVEEDSQDNKAMQLLIHVARRDPPDCDCYKPENFLSGLDIVDFNPKILSFERISDDYLFWDLHDRS